MKTVILSRNAYGSGQHQFHPGLWDLAGHFGFTPKVCRPYRAQTKGKVERFNRYLRHSFYYPLVSRLAQANQSLDVDTANSEVLKWLRDVANVRHHKTLNQIPQQLWQREQAYLQPLPRRIALTVPTACLSGSNVWPIESMQRSPADYDQLLQIGVC